MINVESSGTGHFSFTRLDRYASNPPRWLNITWRSFILGRSHPLRYWEQRGAQQVVTQKYFQEK